jgi:hypothetical protein
MQKRPISKKNGYSRNQRPEPRERDKLYQLILDMKAEMGTMRKAMIDAGISCDKVPNEQKTKDVLSMGKQKNNFAGTAKMRNRKDRVAQRPLVAVKEKDSVSDSNEDPQPEFGGVATVVKAQKRLSPRILNSHSRLAGMKLHDLDHIEQVKDIEASLGLRESLNEVEAHLATEGICTNDLLCSPKIQQPGESRDATDTQGDALETLSTEDLYQDPEQELRVSDEDGGKCVAP